MAACCSLLAAFIMSLSCQLAVFFRHAIATPDRVAIRYEGDDGESKDITFRELLR